MAKKMIFAAFVLLLLPGLTQSGTTGKIAGVVKDKDTGAPLPGVNIVVEGTTLGAASDSRGEFFVINVPVGTYALRASMIGYQAVRVEKVKVMADLTTSVDFQLSATVLELGKVVTVTAERPLLQKDMTATMTIVGGQEIEAMPVNSYQEVLLTTAGFVENQNNSGDDGIHIRGGRSGEIAYMVDGFFVENALYSGMGLDVPRSGMSELAITVGTFNAEYGEAMSGVVNIVTKEGGPEFKWMLRASTDQFARLFRKEPYEFDFGTRRLEASTGGPIPFLGGDRGTFFFSGDLLDTDTYLNRTKHDKEVRDKNGNVVTVVVMGDSLRLDKGHIHRNDTYLQRGRLSSKFVLKPSLNTKLILGGVLRSQKEKPYSHGFKEIPNHAGHNHEDSYLASFTWNHTLSPKTFYTLRASNLSVNFKHHIHKPDSLVVTPLVVTDGWGGTSNYEFYGDFEDITAEGDTIIKVSDDDFRRQYESRSLDIAGDITSQISEHHQVKLGFEFRQLRLWHFWLSGVNAPMKERTYVHYLFRPRQGALYIQDKMEFKDIIVNAGLRLDYLNTRSKYIADPLQPLKTEVKKLPDAEVKINLSPRLGFGYPITDKAVLHFAYGKFIQNPEYEQYYSRSNQDPGTNSLYPFPYDITQGYIPTVGNPNLRPQTTIAYELGMETKLSEDLSADVTVFYKDIYDYVSSHIFDADPTQYAIFINEDYGNAKGVEVSLYKRFSKNFSGRLNYTYSRAEGNSAYEFSKWYDAYLASVYGTIPPKKTITMPWDQPHTLAFNLDIRVPDNWGINFLGTFGSGLPYTPTDARGREMDERNSSRMPWTGNIDVRINKDFHWKSLTYRLFADVKNLLNKRNVLNVFTSTGKPDDSANPNASLENEHRPHYFGPPRQIEIGLSIGFE